MDQANRAATDTELGRRRFLTSAAATAAALAVSSCANGSEGRSDRPTSTTRAASATSTTRHAVKLPGDPFTLGVASGDPLADRVILWTRLAPNALAADGLGAMPDDKVDVIWEVATDDRFAKIVHAGVCTATPRHSHSVHVDVTGLEPRTDYRYRFRVGDHTSRIGRTRTLADGSPDRFAVAVANCQWYETGTYAAYRHMTDEDIDLVVHLGDYIYEPPAVPVPSSRDGRRHPITCSRPWPTTGSGTRPTSSTPTSSASTPATRSSARGMTTRWATTTWETPIPVGIQSLWSRRSRPPPTRPGGSICPCV